jgi:hypothetical protein
MGIVFLMGMVFLMGIEGEMLDYLLDLALKKVIRQYLQKSALKREYYYEFRFLKLLWRPNAVRKVLRA